MFFSPSPACESPLSLRRFKFTEQSIASVSVFSLFFFFVDDDDDDGFVVDYDDDDGVLAVLIGLVSIESVFAVVVIVALV